MALVGGGRAQELSAHRAQIFRWTGIRCSANLVRRYYRVDGVAFKLMRVPDMRVESLQALASFTTPATSGWLHVMVIEHLV